MNPQLLYFAGYFWADGNIERNRGYLGIVQKDSVEVQKIINGHIDYATKLYDHPSKLRQTVETIKIDLIKNQWLGGLIKTKFTNKSFDSPWFVFDFPEELQHYFWRGYSDGDGCFYKKYSYTGGAWSLHGPYDKDWSAEEHLMKKLEIGNFRVNKLIKKLGRSSSLVARHSKEIRKIGDYMYQGEQFGLTRKKDKFDLIMNEAKGNAFTSKYVGVHVDKQSLLAGRKPWKALYNRKYLGYFNTEEEAKEARDNYERTLKLG